MASNTVVNNNALAGGFTVKKAATTFEKPLPRPEPRSLSIPALTRIGSRKLDGEKNVFFWKPYTIRAPFLGSLILITALLIVVIELMVQKHLRDGALFFAEDNGELSTRQTFVSQYAATIIAVIYSILVTLVDFDVKRLEPYYQLSKSVGALGKDSICLKYSVEFLAFVPFSALKRRHWSVFCIGFSTVITFWAITPLQSSLLSNSSVVREAVLPGNVRSGLYPARAEIPTFMFDAFSQSWLGSSPREFTTKEYSILPFEIPEINTHSQNDSWSAMSTAYYADVDCAPAKRVDYTYATTPLNDTQTPSPLRAFYSPQRNCTFGTLGKAVGSSEFRPFYGLWVQYSSAVETSYHLQNTEICNLPADQSNIFFFLLSKQNSPKEDPRITATYCTSRYMSQQAQVSVTSQKPHTVTSVELLGKPHKLDYQEFNSTFFETIINGYNGDTSLDPGPFSSAPQDIAHSASLRAQLDSFSDNPAFPYVVAQQRDLDQLLKYDEQVAAIRKAYKNLFANYVTSQLISNSTSPLNVTQSLTMDAVVVQPVIARILEGFLALVFLLLAILFFLEHKRKLNLLSDPSSISHSMSLVSESHGLLHDFESLDRATSDDVKATLDHVPYRLGGWKDNKYRLEKLGKLQTTRYQPQRGIGDESLVNGMELHRMVGILFLCTILAISILLCVLYWSNTVYQGLPIVSGNGFVVQIIFSFIPTVLATGLEPYWVLLCRRFAMLQPFSNLSERNSKAESSLSLKFTSIPPQLVFTSALRSKHYFLGTVASMCLIANILAVSLGGLFNQTSAYMSRDLVLTQNISDAMSSVPEITISLDTNLTDVKGSKTFLVTGYDQNLVAWANVSNGTPLPSWVTPEYFFLPFSTSNSIPATSIVRGRTVGYGIKATCTGGKPPSITYHESTNGSDISHANTLNMTYSFPDTSTSQECAGSHYVDTTCRDCDDQTWVMKIPSNSTGRVAYEGYPFVNSTTKGLPEGQDSCQSYFLGTWMRSTWNGEELVRSAKTKTVICKMEVVSGEFDVKIDKDSRVLEYSPHGELKSNDPARFQNGIRPLDLLSAYRKLLATNGQTSQLMDEASDGLGFHAAAVVRDWTTQWMTYYLNPTALVNSTDLVNSNLTLPDDKALSSAMKSTCESIFPVLLGLNYQRMFATVPDTQFAGTILSSTKRMAMSTVMFSISIGILIIYLLVGSYIYAFRCKPFLPRYPDSIGSIIAFFYGSRALSDVVGTELLSTRQRNEVLERKGHAYGYGPYKGRDGTIRIGIEAEPLLGFVPKLAQGPTVHRWKFW